MSDKVERFKIIFLLILALAICIRLFGIWHDLPYSYNMDEVHFINRAVSFGSWDFNPHWFHKPAGYMYLLFIEFGIFFLLGRLFGFFSGLNDFIRLYFSNKTSFYLIGRITTAIFGIGIVWLTYKIGTKVFSKKAGIFSALFVSVLCPNVFMSQIVKADIPCSFFSLLSLYFLLQLLEKEKKRYYFYSAIAGGIGTGFKYYPIFMVLLLLLVHIYLKIKKKKAASHKCIILALMSFILAFFIVSPYNFIDPIWPTQIWNHIQSFFINTRIYDPDTCIEYSSNIFSRLKSIVLYLKVLSNSGGLGPILSTFSLIGLAFFLFINTNIKIICLSIYVITFSILAIISGSFHIQPRHLNPIYPVYIILGASFILQILKNKDIIRYCFITVIFFSLLFPTLSHNCNLIYEDTRNIAKKWIIDNIPTDSRILLDGYGSKLPYNKKRLEKFLALAKQEDKCGAFTARLEEYYGYQIQDIQDPSYYIIEIDYPWWIKRGSSNPDDYTTFEARDMGNPLRKRWVESYNYYKNLGVDYAILIDSSLNRYGSETSKDLFPTFYKLFNEIKTKTQLIKTFSGKRGPKIYIYEI